MYPTKAFSRYDIGFSIIFSNGWTLDASFGRGSYSDNHWAEYDMSNPPKLLESDRCESIVLDNLGGDHTLEVAKNLGIRCDGDKKSAILPYLELNDWIRVLNYVNGQKRIVKSD